MTAREMIVALLAYDLDTPLWVGKGIGPVDGIQGAVIDGETVVIIRPVTR
jgi:hypothetical protein